MNAVQTDPTTKLTIEHVSSGFLGHKNMWFLWQGNKVVGRTTDGINWRMGLWFDRYRRQIEHEHQRP